MNELDIIEVVGGEPTVTTLAIAEQNGLPEHRAILQLLRTNLKDFQIFGPIAFEMRKGDPLPQGGFAKATEFARLNERQATLLFTYMRNSEPVRRFKIRLVSEFYRMAEEMRVRDIEVAPGPAMPPPMSPERKMGLLKEIAAIGEQCGDRIMISMAHDAIKNAVLPMLYDDATRGDAPLALSGPAVSSDEWQAYELLEDLGVSGRERRDKASWCGRLLASAYRQEFNAEPEKTLRWIDGAQRRVNIYPLSWRDKAKRLVYTRLQERWAREMRMSGLLDGQLLESDDESDA